MGEDDFATGAGCSIHKPAPNRSAIAAAARRAMEECRRARRGLLPQARHASSR